MAGRFTIESVFKAVDRVTAPVSRMQQRMTKFTRSARRGFQSLNNVTNKLWKGLKRGAQTMALAFALVTPVLANVLGAGANFEQAITDVGAVTLQTRDQIAALEAQAISLGRTTKFTATQAANAMEVLKRSGFSTNDVLKATPVVLSAAAASGLEIADVANHVSNVLKGMELATSEAARVADVLALASARTNSSIGSLGESMKNVANKAAQLNVPLEDVVASVALLQDVGLDASVAGSAMNNMLTKMADPSKTIIKIMKRMNLSFKDVKGNMKTLPAVIADLSTATKRMGGNFSQVAFLAELVGLRGEKAAGNLAKLFESGKLQTLTRELMAAEGVAERMADIRMNTVQGSLLLLGSAVDAVKVKIFGLNQGPLKDLIDGFTEWVSLNEDLIANEVGGFIDELITNLPIIWEQVKMIGKGILIFTAFTIVLKTLVGVLTLVNLLLAANPIMLIVLAVVAAVAAFVSLVTWIDEVIEQFDKLPAIFKMALAPLRLLMAGIKLVKDSFNGGLGSAFEKAAVSLGLKDEEEKGGRGLPGRQIVNPNALLSRSIEESKETSSAELTIRDETGKAEVTKGGLGKNIRLESTGAM